MLVHDGKLVSRHSRLLLARNRAANLKRRFDMDCEIEPIAKGKVLEDFVSLSIQAIEECLPWMILLGDYIGNGTKENPMGRCDSILKLHTAKENLKTLTVEQKGSK